jgi:hypothetical protein
MGAPERDRGAALSDFLSVFGDQLRQLAAHQWSPGFPAGIVDDIHALAETSMLLAEEMRHAGSCPTEFRAGLTEEIAGFFARYQALGSRLAAHLRRWPGAASPTGIALD